MTLVTASEEMAHVCGVPVRRLNYLFVLTLTVVVAMSIRLLGIILVTSLLVIPPAAARALSRNFRQQIILSVIVGLIGGFGGVYFSYQLDAPCGPTIVLTCIAELVVALAIGQLRNRFTVRPA